MGLWVYVGMERGEGECSVSFSLGVVFEGFMDNA